MLAGCSIERGKLKAYKIADIIQNTVGYGVFNLTGDPKSSCKTFWTHNVDVSQNLLVVAAAHIHVMLLPLFTYMANCFNVRYPYPRTWTMYATLIHVHVNNVLLFSFFAIMSIVYVYNYILFFCQVKLIPHCLLTDVVYAFCLSS